MGDVPLTAHDALRPFALFAIEARMAREHRFTIRDADGEDIASLTGQDFATAFAVYTCGDPLCVDGMTASGLSVSQKYRRSLERRIKGWTLAHWPWGIICFILGLMAGARS